MQNEENDLWAHQEGVDLVSAHGHPHGLVQRDPPTRGEVFVMQLIMKTVAFVAGIDCEIDLLSKAWMPNALQTCVSETKHKLGQIAELETPSR